jgi:hypothetical protein
MGFNPEEALAERRAKQSEEKGYGFDPQEALDSRKNKSVAVAEEVLGAEFNMDETASLGLRFDLARGDNMDEKQARIQRRYPEGEVKVFGKSLAMGNDQDILMYRESPQQQWKMVDPPGFTTSKDGEVSRFNVLHWDWADVVEAMAPSTEALAGEVLTLPVTKGSSVPGVVFKQMMGAASGEAFEQAVQAGGGVQKQSIADIVKEVGFEGLATMVGGFLASPFVALNNALRGRGAMRVGEEGMETLRAANELSPDLAKKLTPGMVVDNPAIRLSEKQSAALLPGLQRNYREAIVELDKAVTETADPKQAALSAKRVMNALKGWGRSLLNRVGNPKNTMREGGLVLKEGIEEYDLVAKAINSRLYAVARNIEEPVFDASTWKTVASDLRIGKYGNLDPKVERAIRDLEEIDGPLQLSDDVLSETDQLRNVRTSLYDLQHTPPGDFGGQGKAQAKDLYSAITRTLKTPTNSNPAFLSAWRAANDAAAERFATLQRAAVITAARTETPATVARGLAKPGQVDSLLVLRDTVEPKYWREFQKSFYADTLGRDAPFDALKAFDQETLDVIVPRSLQPDLLKAAKELQNITRLNADEILDVQIKNKNFINEIIEGADPGKYRTLMKAFNETNDRAARDSVRASVIQWAWDGVVGQGKNTLVANPKILKANIKQLKKNGLWNLLTADQRVAVSNANMVTKAFGGVIDAGTSIQAASAVQGVKEMRMSAIRTFVNAYLVERFYLSAAGRKILLGTGIPNSNGAKLRLITNAAWRVGNVEDISQLAEEQKDK